MRVPPMRRMVRATASGYSVITIVGMSTYGATPSTRPRPRYTFQKERVVNRKDQKQLEPVRRGQGDKAEHLAKSQEAIEDLMALLHHSDRMEVARRPQTGRRDTEGHGPHRAGQKTSPSRSGTWEGRWARGRSVAIERLPEESASHAKWRSLRPPLGSGYSSFSTAPMQPRI